MSACQLPTSCSVQLSACQLPTSWQKDQVKHPDDKWLTDVLTKTSKCQPAVRDTLVTVPHTPRVTVGVPDSRLARQQNKNKQNAKHKNQKSNYLSNVTLVDSVKLTKWFNHGHGYLVIPHILRESLWRSLSALVTASILRESLHKQSQVTLHTKQYNLSQVSTKSKKCQPDAGDRPDLIQTEPVPSTGLACSKSNYLSDVTLVYKGQVSKVKHIWSQSSGHDAAVMAAVMAQRSRLSGHGHVTAVTAVTAVIASPVTCSTVSISHSISNKRRNNLIKQSNGNGKSSLSICHWNLGSKKWKNKRNQIQALVDQDNPDVMFISEANLDDLTLPHESLISGYNITLPKTVTRNGTAQIVLLTKENIEFKLRDDLMDDIFSSIWIKIKRPGSKGLLICGLYREHQYLLQDTDWSLQPVEQNRRWMHFLRQVETARLS